MEVLTEHDSILRSTTQGIRNTLNKLLIKAAERGGQLQNGETIWVGGVLTPIELGLFQDLQCELTYRVYLSDE